LRSARRPRRFVPKHWLLLLKPVFVYSHTRDAYVLRGVGDRLGPVLRHDRRVRREQPVDGIDFRRRRRRARIA
jgi:hypothetical protein